MQNIVGKSGGTKDKAEQRRKTLNKIGESGPTQTNKGRSKTRDKAERKTKKQKSG
uniref:Uncharacterized protein n=1 Tax=uncultured Muribaculaceae bacterium TaxID=2301481 RepID=A0A6G8F3I1_9BACT|nr:hypothetical protein Muribac1_1040 [uncultured Muribaculaceae bacterium]